MEATTTHDQTDFKPAAVTVVIVMGVAGCGKTTVAKDLAGICKHQAVFIEGDDYHPEHNKAKMSRGEPLSDADREPWLRSINAAIHTSITTTHTRRPLFIFVSCSALKQRHRNILREVSQDSPESPRMHFIHLRGKKSTIQARLEKRKGHFMKVGMLDSQFEALEDQGADEQDFTVIELSEDMDEDMVLNAAERALTVVVNGGIASQTQP